MMNLLRLGSLCFALLAQIHSHAERDENDVDEIEEIIVTGSLIEDNPGIAATSVLDTEVIQRIEAEHPHEVMTRVPGVWVTRNSGQEHLTAIRSPVLTGSGACGAFLLLENEIPVRPSGFCNVNGLFEVNLEQASQVEVVRGPASARFGGNALYGVINSIYAPPASRSLSLQSSNQSYYNLKAQTRFGPHALSAFHSTERGFREATGYKQQKMNYQFRNRSDSHTHSWLVSVSNLDQETGGYVRGFKAYEDPELRKTNPNPEAYRQAQSIRLSYSSQPINLEQGWDRKFFIRRSDMDFLQHFLPGQPLERNAQSSIGIILERQQPMKSGAWDLGFHGELLQGELTQFQAQPTEGSSFLVATRPQGIHYDYSLRGLSTAIYHQYNQSLSSATVYYHSARIEFLRYVYDNRTLDGNTKSDGTACGFGGCLYSRPEDRSDHFLDTAARIGLSHETRPGRTFNIQFATGFRPPQSTELYRLQSGQSIAELDSEGTLSLEGAWTYDVSDIFVQLIGYAQTAKNLIFRDSNGYNVSQGETGSVGVELDFAQAISHRNQLAFQASWARHRYRRDLALPRGEQIESGHFVDTAPERTASLRWVHRFVESIEAEVELYRLGSHFIDIANKARYGGHTVLNIRSRFEITSKIGLNARLLNVLDARYADRADFAFGSYRYFPAPGRDVRVTIQFSL